MPNPTVVGPGWHVWIEARNNAANLITQFAAEKFFINGAIVAGVNSFNLSPVAPQTAIGWDQVVHIACDGTSWHVIQGDPLPSTTFTQAQYFTASGTYIPTKTGNYFVSAQGAGGGGAAGEGVNSPTANEGEGGDGGGQGVFNWSIQSLTAGTSYAVTIGTGGAGGAAAARGSPNDGADGTATTFAGLVTAGGGLGGRARTTQFNSGTGGGLPGSNGYGPGGGRGGAIVGGVGPGNAGGVGTPNSGSGGGGGGGANTSAANLNGGAGGNGGSGWLWVMAI